MTAVIYHGGSIFDGTTLHADQALRVEAGQVAALGRLRDVQVAGADLVDLSGDILSPGYVDLQLNGGGGLMLGDALDIAGLRRIAAAHRGLGATHILPTLITNTPEVTRAAIDAVQQAIAAGVPGIMGLHLEGSHLSVARKGAHDGALIRPLEEADLAMLTAAARALPVLFLTIAPENVTLAQVRALVAAGAILSLGHTDADYDTAMAYFDAGVRSATHLFNAMSGLASRAPGVVGAVLDHPQVTAGVIADGVHVHPATLRLAWRARAGGMVLVSDAMAVAGTDLTAFELDGRQINRCDGRLTLADGTLAGADLDLTTAVKVLHQQVGVPLDEALHAATAAPAALIGAKAGRLEVGAPCDLIRITSDLSAARPVGVSAPEVPDAG